MKKLPQTLFFISFSSLSVMAFAGLVEFANADSYYVDNPEFDWRPTSGIVNEKLNAVYITDFFGSNVVVLDGTTNSVIDTIPVVKTPFGIGFNSRTNLIYVGGEFENILSVLNATNTKAVKEIVLKDPYDIAVNPNNNKIYVTSDRENLVYVIDGEKNEIETSFEVLIPCGIAVNYVTGMVYVTSESENIVHVWDGNSNQFITTIKVQESPRGVTVNPRTNMVYVTNQEDNTVSVINGTSNTVVGHVKVGEIPRRVVTDFQSNTIYVSNQGSKDISVINGESNKVIETIPVLEPFELAINSDSGKLYSMYHGSGLSIISKSADFSSPLKQIKMGTDPKKIQCSEGLILVFKLSNQSPACVKPSSVLKLIERGWAEEITPNENQ